jgi:hypothetical protein
VLVSVRRKKPEYSGHFVCHTAHLQRRTGSARTSLGQIFENISLISEPN